MNTNTEFNDFPGYLAMTFDDMMKAGYSNDTSKLPTEDEMKDIEADIQTMKLAGAATGGGGAFTCTIASLMGRELSFVTGLAAIAVGVYGYSVIVSAQRLQAFADKWIKKNNEEKNGLLAAAKGMNKAKFKQEMLKAGIEDIMLLRILYSNALNKARTENKPKIQ